MSWWPCVTTLEVEIYSAIRFDFILPAAAGLSLFTLTAIVVGVGAACGGMMAPITTSDTSAPSRFDLSRQDWMRDCLALTLAAMLILLPIGLILLNGLILGCQDYCRPQFWDACRPGQCYGYGVGTVVGGGKGGFVAAPLGTNCKCTLFAGYDGSGVMLYLVIPSVVLGTAAFVLLRARGDIFGYGVVIANTLMALPFAYRLL